MYEVIEIHDEQERYVRTEYYPAKRTEKIGQDVSHTYSTLFYHQLKVAHTGQHPFRGLEKLAHEQDSQQWMENIFEEIEEIKSKVLK